MFTWHNSELDIQRILSYKNKSKEKRAALRALRKKGNFLRNRTTNEKLRPVKRLQNNIVKSFKEDFLPCKYCYGFYKRNSLYRHTKKCPQMPENVEPGKRQTSQSDGHTLLNVNSLEKQIELLKKELFPRLRADDVSRIVKTDPLICSYGYSYLKGRRRKGNIELVKQNMRRLAKLVKHSNEKCKDIKHVIDLLRPCYFGIIIDGVNEIACYNSETEKYESPTLAMNFGTLLKKCCDLAIFRLLQEDNTEWRRKEIKILKQLVESQWANEVSAQAATNLNEKKWNKSELLPLTTDLKKLHLYLKDNAEENFSTLQEIKNNETAYNNLKEIIYSQIILLNRRRPAEVAQIKINTFKSVNLSCEKETEFDSCLTETEKILLNRYSRFIVEGKRGRGVPILLSPDMKTHLELLLETRHNFVQNNDYIFHSGGAYFIDGTRTLRKYAIKSGAQRPNSITATRLRKHLATITQLLQFSESDLEQLSNFMGHTLKTHCDMYRMPDDVYQTAKVSKLLLLMTEGGAEQFKGKSLEEIDVDLNPVSENITFENEIATISNADYSEYAEKLKGKVPENEDEKTVDQQAVRKRCVNRRIWSIDEKRIIANHFKDHIKEKRPPKKDEVMDFVRANPNFQDKWSTIKAVVYNIYSKKLKI